MDPCTFFKCLADDTRLKSLLLLTHTPEACVCDLMQALALDQPKISRHLALLRQNGILMDERRGKWVYYSLHPQLPQWVRDAIISTAKHNLAYFNADLQKLIAAQASSNLSC